MQEPVTIIAPNTLPLRNKSNHIVLSSDNPLLLTSWQLAFQVTESNSSSTFLLLLLATNSDSMLRSDSIYIGSYTRGRRPVNGRPAENQSSTYEPATSGAHCCQHKELPGLTGWQNMAIPVLFWSSKPALPHWPELSIFLRFLKGLVPQYTLGLDLAVVDFFLTSKTSTRLTWYFLACSNMDQVHGVPGTDFLWKRSLSLQCRQWRKK